MGVYSTEKKFGENSKILSIRIPESEFESIKTTIKEYIDNFRENNLKKIETIQDGLKEFISFMLDIKDYIGKEERIYKFKYLEILSNHNSDLIEDLIAKFPIERKPSIKTLTEEKREEEIRKEELRKKEEEVREKSRYKTGFEGFGLNYYDYLHIKKLKDKRMKKRAKKLWKAYYNFYGEVRAFGEPTKSRLFWREL